MVNPGNPAAGALRYADTWSIGLAFSGAALQLPHQFDHLRYTRCTQSMALGEQAAARVDRNTPTELASAGFKQS